MSAAPPWPRKRPPIRRVQGQCAGQLSHARRPALRGRIGASGSAADRRRSANAPSAPRSRPALVPGAVAALELPDRQRVEELVGDEQHRARRQRREGVVPLRLMRPRAPLPERAQRRAASRPDAAGARRESRARRARARSASAISVPRPGPSSTSSTGSGAPMRRQTSAHHSADQLAEHLADLRRGDEVAGGAQGIARRVIDARCSSRM